MSILNRVNTKDRYTGILLLSGAILFMILYVVLSDAETSVNLNFLWRKIVKPLIRLSIFISIGLMAGQIIEAMGWTKVLNIMARPFMKWGHLTNQMGTAFTSAFLSGTSSLSMLSGFYRDGKVNDRELTISVLLNTFPSYFLHLPTTFFIIYPLVKSAGVIYLLVTFVAALVRALVVITYSHFKLPPPGDSHIKEFEDRTSVKDILKKTGRKYLVRIKRIMLIIIPIYTGIAFLVKAGFFTWLRHFIAGYITTTFVPVEAMSIVVFTIVAEFTSGFAVAGAMMSTGALTVFDTVIALLVGNILATPIRAVRHQLPIYLGIFPPAKGTKLVFLTQAFRVSSIIVSGGIFAFLVYSGYINPYSG